MSGNPEDLLAPYVSDVHVARYNSRHDKGGGSAAQRIEAQNSEFATANEKLRRAFDETSRSAMRHKNNP